MKPRGQRSCHL